MEDGKAGADDSAVDSAPVAVLQPTFSWGAGTHVGGVRDHNEDAFFVSGEVCVVADGMGGHEAGEVASQLVTHIVADVFGAHRLEVSELPRFVSALNAAVLRKGVENNTRGMGTTVVGMAVADNGDAPSAVVFHVGDSRCYRLCNGVMRQLTSDHSHVQELVQAGRITPDEALTHPLRNVITRALGADAAVEADFHVLDEEDCRILLCSDGLSNEIDDDRIWDLLTSHADPTAAAVALIDAVLEGPARDNVTAIVVDVAFPEPDLARSTIIPQSVAVLADVTAELDLDLTKDRVDDVTADLSDDTLETDVTADPLGWRRVDQQARAAVSAADEAGDDPTEEIVIVRPWAPPDALDRQSDEVDRPPAGPDGAAWASPDADSADPIHATDQETGHAR
jgi:serine/threonine protein phosphatase PrpC